MASVTQKNVLSARFFCCATYIALVRSHNFFESGLLFFPPIQYRLHVLRLKLMTKCVVHFYENNPLEIDVWKNKHLSLEHKFILPFMWLKCVRSTKLLLSFPKKKEKKNN